MKTGRQHQIIRLLQERTVASQNELVTLLRAAGYPVTQATISRDLEELGAVKVRRDGRVVYSLPPGGDPAPAGVALRRALSESVVAIESTGNLVVVKTPPGHAQMVAAAIDRGPIEGVVGTVAGDDTILVVCRMGVQAEVVESRLRPLAGIFHAETDDRTDDK